MKVGDLIGIGWNGKQKQPYVAMVKRVSKHGDGLTVYVIATGNEQYILKDLIREVK